VPRLRRFPVFASFFREYKRNSPDFNLRIIGKKMPPARVRLAANEEGPADCYTTKYFAPG
jgi:hypothetical protein